MRGGVRTTSVVAGQSKQSLVLHVLEGRNNLEMPPGGANKKLPPETIAAFRSCIAGGATWAERKQPAQWSYKPEDLFAPGKRIDDLFQGKIEKRQDFDGLSGGSQDVDPAGDG